MNIFLKNTGRTLSLLLILLFLQAKSYSITTDSIRFGAFGKVLIYKPDGAPKSVVLLISDEKGWNKGMTEIAKSISHQDALVAGIDLQRYLRNLSRNLKCFYPSGDFETLSMLLQKHYKIAHYLTPILVGYSEGASVAYGTLAQAPSNTFKGGIGISFNPDIILAKPLCNGLGLTSHLLADGKTYHLDPTKKLTAQFIVLAGMKDQSMHYEDIQKYFQDIPKTEVVLLPKVKHNFSSLKLWMPQFAEAHEKIAKAPSFAQQKAMQNTLLQSQHLAPLPEDIPITLIPAVVKDTMPLAFMISGDGGWTSFDQSLSEALAQKGFPVVGLDAQKYFWNGKTPEQTTGDISKALEHFMGQWGKNRFILVGYSFGASVIPFIANRFPSNLKKELSGIYSLSPDIKADFEIHIADMLDISNTEDDYDVLKEIKKISVPKPVCIFGEEEDNTVREEFAKTGIKIFTLPGSHHFNNNFAGIEELIRKNFK